MCNQFLIGGTTVAGGKKPHTGRGFRKRKPEGYKRKKKKIDYRLTFLIKREGILCFN